MTDHVVLPGETISSDVLPIPSIPSIPLKLGPGLRHTPPSTITTTLAGSLCIDHKKNAIWVDNHNGRLPHLAFENATKKTRPQLAARSLVYAKVVSASRHLDPEIACCNTSTGKADGMGELKGGMVFDVSLGMARRLLLPPGRQRDDGGLVVLDELAEKLAFEIAVGRNGRLWVKANTVRETMAVGKAVQETDKRALDLDEQRKLVRKLVLQI
ncbi:MAG: hypothetical protein LQ351_006909 [Letrouitia transgressa]|nr:MAG: hypothetical protein LQ351_006909 [Letrouitia transgressa]